MLRLTRPKQWIKNSFVLAPLIFARAYSDVSAIETALFAFVLFCIASAACYIVNDIHDIASDRAHPRKRLSRPLVALGARLSDPARAQGSPWGALLLGLGTGLLWTPCAGPILGLLLTGEVLDGALTPLLLLAYALGACTSLACCLPTRRNRSIARRSAMVRSQAPNERLGS